MTERFGDYVVTGSLGQGAMGVVLRVRHATLGVERALKLLSQVTPERLARFEREGRTLAEVRHPSVVAVHETGVHDGRPWFVMDLVEGRPLDDLLRTAGRLPVAQVVSLGAGLARGLAALHGSGVVHRDLKPSNVLVRPDGSPVIVDLGVALAPESEDDRLTRTGALVGTLSYMAPEQLMGERATAASDVYALGAILFEAACGTPAAPDAPSLQEFIARVVEAPAPRLGDVEPDLPAGLDRLLVRAMARAAAGRPSAADLAAALEAPGLATSGPAGARRSRVLALIVVAALAAAGGAGALVSTWPEPVPLALPLPPPPPATAPITSTADAAAVTRAFERALALPDPLTRRRALADWLGENPDEPRAEAALAAWRATLREAPLAVWQLAPGKRVHGVLLGDGRALGWLEEEAGLWLADPWTGVAEVVREDLRVFSAEHDPLGGVHLLDEDARSYRLDPRTSALTAERQRRTRPGPVHGLAVTELHLALVKGRFVYVFDRRSRAVVTRLEDFDAPREVALADDGRVLVVTTAAPGNAGWWLHSVEVGSGERLANLPTGARVSVLVPAADAQVLVATTSAVLSLFDARTGLERVRFVSPDVRRGLAQTVLAHDGAVRDAAFVEGGRRLVSIGGVIGGAHGDLRCWDVATGLELAPPLRFGAACLRLDVARDERTVLLSFETGALEVWAAPHRTAELDVDRSTR